ncbi:MAG: hypothetical protein IJP99_07090 [Methanobrevibacter sp.]|nr:hypothetical protein [Methanobrevibacter sp.]
MKNNKITNNFLKKVVGPDNSDNAKKILRKLESGVASEEELCKKVNQKDITKETINKLLNKLRKVSITECEVKEDPETKTEILWKFNEETMNEQIEEFSPQNEIINNPITNDFLEERVDSNDLEYIKYIIIALIDGIETDEAIHDQTDIKLNTVRKLLYKLHDASIANYKRNKDPETQWFTYTWRFEKEEYIEKITEFYTERLNKRESILEDLENNLYFICCMEPEHFKGDYTESSEYEFYCPVCDYELEPYDAETEKKSLKKEINKDKRNFKKFEASIKE